SIDRSQELAHRPSDLRIWMHRIDDGDVRMPGGDGAKSLADAADGHPEALPAVRGHQDVAVPVAELALNDGCARSGHEQRVDDRVAGDENVARGDALVEQRARCGKRRSEMDVRHGADDAPVDFLRERIEAVR